VGLVLTNTYDAADRKTNVSDSKGGSKDYVWDNADRLTQVKYSDSSSQLRFDFTYSNRNQVTQIDRYTDTAGTQKKSLTQYVYDDGGKPTSITHKDGAGTTTIDSFSYQYDNAGRVTQETSTLGRRATTRTTKQPAHGDGTNTYGFDLNGNRTMSGYTIGTGNRYSSAGGYSITWDDEGNMATKSKTGEYWTYAYNNDNQLTDVKEYNSSGGPCYRKFAFPMTLSAIGSRKKSTPTAMARSSPSPRWPMTARMRGRTSTTAALDNSKVYTTRWTRCLPGSARAPTRTGT